MPPKTDRRRRGAAVRLVVALLAASCAGEPARQPLPPATRETRIEPTRASELAAAVPPAREKTSPSSELESLLALGPDVSASIGGPNDGRVEGAVPFPLEGPGFRFNPRRRPEARFGTVELVQALVEAAMVVDAELPGSELVVNDLGHENGGPIPQHGSHQSGRDVDVLFYLLGSDGRPMPAVGAPLDPDGEGVDFRDLALAEDDVPVRLDVPRTFRFVRALLESERASVQRIFVAEHLRALLLAHARATSAPAPVVSRFEAVTCQPGSPHDDHLHVRFFCAPDDIRVGCHDERPIYPWHRRALQALGLSPVAARPRPNRPRAPTTSPEAARARAGAMHPLVVEWLDRREAWLRPPHPGRRYCR